MRTLFLSVLSIVLAAVSFSQIQKQQIEDAQTTYIQADKELNEVYQRLLLTHTNATFVQNLKKAQRQWMKFRDAQVELMYPGSKGGNYSSTLTVGEALYLARLTRERTNTLQEMLELPPSGPQAKHTFVATGGTITSSGGKMIHVFTSSGIFSCVGSGVVEVLVVAGGGGGGCHTGGGGGAGGVVYVASYAATGNIPVIVGVGGNGSTKNNVPGSNGSNSIFGMITAIGGGGGASRFCDANDGGSGGGGGPKDMGNCFGRGIVGLGHDGGMGGNAWNFLGGGGGGAGNGGSGGTGSGGNGDGGMGVAYSISGSLAYYGGGGGGGVYGADIPGAGGVGGGGMGSNSTSIVGDGIPNTGGGGGGGGLIERTYVSRPGGNGGSGIVIVSYPVR